MSYQNDIFGGGKNVVSKEEQRKADGERNVYRAEVKEQKKLDREMRWQRKIAGHLRINRVLSYVKETGLCSVCRERKIPLDTSGEMIGTTCGRIPCLTKALLPRTSAEALAMLEEVEDMQIETGELTDTDNDYSTEVK